ncbi:MAG: homogentisate 1,2-dioxygenase, partial [Schleiferiaceae bacterium]|nr:homogentisate 1,2-dioxygenase [Schleiferiaceae bacterium]
FISLHPAGIPHGPHPGAYERSIGQTATEELAVMVDTFRPLQLTQAAIDMGMNEYWASWQES